MTSIQDYLNAEGYYVSTTVGCSMLPLLKNRRDRVIIRTVPEAGLQKYDLALYLRPDGKYVLHRVIGFFEEGYLIRGDNTYVVEKVPRDWVLGYVTEFYRKKKHFDCKSSAYLRYAKIWNAVYPLRAVFRSLLYLPLAVLRKFKRFIFKSSKKEDE